MPMNTFHATAMISLYDENQRSLATNDSFRYPIYHAAAINFCVGLNIFLWPIPAANFEFIRSVCRDNITTFVIGSDHALLILLSSGYQKDLFILG